MQYITDFPQRQQLYYPIVKLRQAATPRGEMRHEHGSKKSAADLQNGLQVGANDVAEVLLAAFEGGEGG